MNDLEVRLRRLQDDYSDRRPVQPMEPTVLAPVTLEGAAPVPHTARRRRPALLVPAFVIVALAGAVPIAALHGRSPSRGVPAIELVPGPPIPIPDDVPGPPAIFHWTTSVTQGGATLTNERWLASGPDLLGRGAYPATGKTGGSLEYGNCRRETSGNAATGSSEVFDPKANTITAYPATATTRAAAAQSLPSNAQMVRALLAASRLPASTPANGTLDGKPVIMIDGWREPDNDSVSGFYLDPVTHHPITYFRRTPTEAPAPIRSEAQRFTSYEILPVTPENLKLFDLHVQHPAAREAAKPTTDCPAG